MQSLFKGISINNGENIQISHVKNGIFEVGVLCNSNKPKLTRYRWDYRILLYDVSGRLISDEDAYLRDICLMQPSEMDLSYMKHGDSFKFYSAAYSKSGKIRIGSGIYIVKCEYENADRSVCSNMLFFIVV